MVKIVKKYGGYLVILIWSNMNPRVWIRNPSETMLTEIVAN